MDINLDWRREASALWPEVSYEIRPLKVWAFQELLGFWEQHGRPEVEDDATPRTGAAEGVLLVDVAKRIFPEHVRALQGVSLVQEGQSRPVPVEALCEETSLLKLAAEIVSRLIAISEISRDEEKN